MVGLFWNLNGSDRRQAVAALCREHGVDVLAVAECGVPPSDVTAALSDADLPGFAHSPRPDGTGSRVAVFVRRPTVELQGAADDGGGRVAIRRLAFAGGAELLLVVVHLPSKLHARGDDQTLAAARLARRVAEAEGDFGHTRTVVVGDLNMDPFDPGVVSAECLHGVMTRRIAAGEGRTVAGEFRRYFYNPMWRFYGDRDDGPPGSFYRPASGQAAYFWHLYDQVLVRPALANALRSVRILDRVGPRSLLTPRGRPDARVGSDHLPLLFALDGW